MIQLIGKTANGKIFKCDKCSAIHVEFKNMGFNLSEKQFPYFAESILDLDGNEWETRNKGSYFSRKILIPTGHNTINILLNNQELNELKELLTDRSGTKVTFNNISNDNFLIPSFCN
ncbi:DUF6686 family protein [uncultured Sunxiuqinia sp.]|uniref:DUF6686 family protein n=1 Tax=uncultured Sunxiuqinia sp. TaxID=1573825 RepID=UPI002AA64566|nr:DUF6686 family protein [uncultured Sunxiuqinia sp.]